MFELIKRRKRLTEIEINSIIKDYTETDIMVNNIVEKHNLYTEEEWNKLTYKQFQSK